MQRVLATICSICPFCIARRRWPDSAYGRFMRRIEAICPFCRAYDRLREGKGQK
jgi:hypothetical protein